MRSRIYFPSHKDGNDAYDELTLLAQAMDPRPTDWGQVRWEGVLIWTSHPELFASFKKVCEKKFSGRFKEGRDIPARINELITE